MPWQRHPESGLIVPRERRVFNDGSPLAAGLRSLWVPALNAGGSFANLVPGDAEGVASFPSTGQTPALTSTNLGPALQFDGTDDVAVRSVNVPYAPAQTFPATIAVACRIDSIPVDRRVIYGFSDVNAAYSLELRIATNFVSLAFTADNHQTSTPCDIYVSPNVGEVVLICGVVDSLTNSRLSFFEPLTGNFQSAAANNGITTQAGVNATTWAYESLGAFYGGSTATRAAPVSILDAWFWNRALTDDEIDYWRRDRFSVLRSPRRRSRAVNIVQLVGPRFVAAQTLAPPTQVATLTKEARAQQALTLPPLSQDAFVARLLGLRQAKVLLPPAQTATGRTTATALQGTLVFAAPVPTADVTTVSWDSTTVTADGAGGPEQTAPTTDSTVITWDSTAVTIDGGARARRVVGLTLPPVTQVARLGQILPGTARAVQSLGPITQTASVTAKAGLAASHTTVLPAQTATAVAVPLTGSTSQVSAAQALAPITQVATATAVALAANLSASHTTALPTQAATATAVAETATLSASQTLSVLAQTATATAVPIQPTVASLTASQLTLLPASTATAKLTARGTAAQFLPLPVQLAQLQRVLQSNLTATQSLQSVIQTARVVPFEEAPPEGETLPPRFVERLFVQPANGDREDMLARMADALPPWFGVPGILPTNLRMVMSMAASVGNWLYDLIGYARKQTRIATATDFWLDLIAFDFFGLRVRRRLGQSDAALRRRIMVEMFRPRVTRPAMRAVLLDLTGAEPRIFEPGRPQDTGGIGPGNGIGLGVAGAIGSQSAEGEVFIDVFRTPDAGIPSVAGIGTAPAGIGVPSRFAIVSLEQIAGSLTDQDVYGAIEATRPAGIRVWVRILPGRSSATITQ